MKISFIMIVLNGMPFIKAALESLQNALDSLMSIPTEWERIGGSLESDDFIDKAFDNIELARKQLKQASTLVKSGK